MAAEVATLPAVRCRPGTAAWARVSGTRDGFCRLAAATPGETSARAILPGAILPGAMLWGLGIGLAVAPLTAGVLAAVDDTDLGEATAINDAPSRVGGVIVIALVPVLLGVGGASSLAQLLAGSYRSAMLVMAGLSLVAAAITALFVAHGRTPGAPPLRLAAPRVHACALPQPTAH